MSGYAYEDEERTKEIKAHEAGELDRNIRYYCPNKLCNAHMYIRSVDGEKRQHFAASRKYRHIANCFGGNSNCFDPNKSQIDGFDLEDAIIGMMTPGEKKKTNKNKNKKGKKGGSNGQITIPHTIRQIYDMCKYYSCDEEINGVKVGYILFDERSAHMYPKGIFGYKLIEARYIRYDRNNRRIYLEAPINDKKYDLRLEFNDELLFNEMNKMLYNNRNMVIVVAGKWERTNRQDTFKTTILAKKQIKVIRIDL